MKKRSFLMAAFAALFMAGCSDNDLNQNNKIIEKDANLYMRVSIANPSGVSSRAGEENVGNSGESEIKKIQFVFYDKEENYIGNTPINNPTSITTKTDPSNYDLILDLVVPVELTAGMGEPYYVMAYVNPTNTYGSDQQSSLGKVRTLVRKLNDIIPIEQGTSKHEGFTMTNSVYYDKEDKIVMAAKIPEGGLFKSREDAVKEDLADNLKLKINVERLVAKVSVGYSENVTADNIDDSNTGNEVGNETKHTLKFKPLAWGLNNLEKYTFLVKNFRTNNENMKGEVMDDDGKEEPILLTTVTNQSHNNATSAIGSWTWNVSDKFRSYWAYSPTYFVGGKYPSTASQYQSVKKGDDAYSLKYHTFNDFYKDGTIGEYGQKIDKTECIYTLENTCDAGVLANQAQRALTSVVVVGQYYVDDATTPQTFYLRRTDKNIYYYTEEGLQQAFIAMNEDLQYIGTMVDNNFTLLEKWEDLDFVIEHPEKEITGAYDAPSRYVTIKLKNKTGKYYYKNGNGQPTQILENNLAEANAALYNTLAANDLGGIIKFNEGRAYFNLPIKHHITDDTSKEGPVTGDYGVVRNHAYVLNLKGIDGIGIGVATPEDPIIVPVEKQEFHVRTELNVLNWTVISQGDVTLKN